MLMLLMKIVSLSKVSLALAHECRFSLCNYYFPDNYTTQISKAFYLIESMITDLDSISFRYFFFRQIIALILFQLILLSDIFLEIYNIQNTF